MKTSFLAEWFKQRGMYYAQDNEMSKQLEREARQEFNAGYEDIMKSRFQFMRSCPQCEAEIILEKLPASEVTAYGRGIRVACLAVLEQTHECKGALCDD